MKLRLIRLDARTSLHGGHSRPRCAHSDDRLEDLVEAARSRGMTTFGVTEHAPRARAADLDDDERDAGMTPDSMDADMRSLVEHELPRLRCKFADELCLPVGLETDVVPEGDFVDRMRALRRRYSLDYLVASVHHVNEIPIDNGLHDYQRAMASCGGPEALQLRYYELQRHLIQGLRPEIVGHFDFISGYSWSSTPSLRVRETVIASLTLMAGSGIALEINASRVQQGHREPFPATWILKEAYRLGVPISLADDSHRVSEVGAGLDVCVEIARSVGYREMVGVVR